MAQGVHVSTRHVIPQVTEVRSLHHEVDSTLDSGQHGPRSGQMPDGHSHVSVRMTDSPVLTAGIRKIKASTATGRDEEKNSCKMCCARASDGSNNALSGKIVVLRP